MICITIFIFINKFNIKIFFTYLRLYIHFIKKMLTLSSSGT